MEKESERQVEEFLQTCCNERGWLCEKFTSPNRRSVPDRIISMSNGYVAFVECKSTTGKLTSGQARDHERRRKLGHQVYVASSTDDVDRLMHRLLLFAAGGKP